MRQESRVNASKAGRDYGLLLLRTAWLRTLRPDLFAGIGLSRGGLFSSLFFGECFSGSNPLRLDPVPLRDHRFAIRLVQPPCTCAGILADASGFAAAVPKIIELCPADLASPH